jgi:hypothetical protein
MELSIARSTVYLMLCCLWVMSQATEPRRNWLWSSSNMIACYFVRRRVALGGSVQRPYD